MLGSYRLVPTAILSMCLTLLTLVLVACSATTDSKSTTSSPSSVSSPAEPPNEALQGELLVSAAASLTDAFGEAAAAFQAEHPNVIIRQNFAGSQQLAQQLGQGAPADVFVSANQRQMDIVIAAGRVVSGTPRTLVNNRLVVIFPADNPAGLQTLQDLTQPGLKLVLASPEVPVGGYSMDFLHKASATDNFGTTFSETVLSNVVSYEENVRTVLSKVVLGEADAGIVYTSDLAGTTADEVGSLEIPDDLNTIASYPIAVVADSKNPHAAQAYVDFLLTPAGQAILAAYGFVPADRSAP